jgi:AcrR family transcriptional regulator
LPSQASVKETTVKDARLTQAERTEISDQRMFDAAIALINERGPAATSLSDVGVSAGYSRGLASHRFGSKDRLFDFVVRRVGDIWLEQLKNATGGEVGFAAIEQAVDQHYQFCVEAPASLRAFYTLWFESVNSKSELNDTINSIHQRRFQDVVNWVLNDPSISEQVKREADMVAAQFGASVIGIVYYWLGNFDKLSEIKRLHDGLKQTMMRLLK